MAVKDRHIEIEVGGNQVPAYLVLPGGTGKHPGLLLIEEIFGVNDHIQDVCRRYAGEGYAVISVELFHREAEPHTPYSEFMVGRDKRSRLTDAQVMAEMRAGVDYLKALDEVDEDRVGVLGYCMGGRMSYFAATKMPDLAACVVYYGGGIVTDELNENAPVAPISLTNDIPCPVQCHFAENDHAVPLEHVEQIRQALNDAGKTNDVFVSEGAGNGFYCVQRDGSFHEKSAKLAWNRTQDFLAKTLKN
jgi:carboxymethylenebutenolidase